MEQDSIYDDEADYIETETGNKVSRRAHIYGSQNIAVGGKVTSNYVKIYETGREEEIHLILSVTSTTFGNVFLVIIFRSFFFQFCLMTLSSWCIYSSLPFLFFPLIIQLNIGYNPRSMYITW